VDIRADDSALAALPHGAHLALPSAVARPVHTSPPRLCRLDLPTLFAALLI
jgi:hypothetical protein